MSSRGFLGGGFARAVLTSVLTVALSELLRYLLERREQNVTTTIVDGADPAARGQLTEDSAMVSSGTPVRGRRWYTYQTWYTHVAD